MPKLDLSPDGALVRRILLTEARVGRLELAANRRTPLVWIAPTLVNSWVNFDGGYGQAGYSIDGYGIVRLRGIVKNGTLNATVFTLPTGYRPALSEIFASVQSANAFARVDVTAAGAVASSGATSNAYLSLSGVSFSVA